MSEKQGIVASRGPEPPENLKILTCVLIFLESDEMVITFVYWPFHLFPIDSYP